MVRSIAAFAAGAQARDGQDIRLTNTGDLDIVEGLEDVRQRVIERLRFWFGQWYAGVNDGVPYRPEIFQRSTTVGLAAVVVSDQIRSVAEVTGVSNVFAEIDPQVRRMTYRARVSTVHGTMEIGETIG